MSITITGITKDFGKTKVLKNINLTVKEGELLALLGPSGSGKTTLLRMIAGLEHASKGDIFFDGNNMTNVNAKDRNVGFVFQHYALFSHMKVKDNIAYGLRVKKKKDRPTKSQIDSKVNELLELVKLEGLGERYPSQLSGGQKQRVALARSLAIEPSVLLLDEPFGALDAQVRKELRRWLRTLHKQTGVTTVFVTHDQEEALDVADQVIVLNDGEIIQEGTPSDIYDSPNSPFMYRFLGNANELKGTATKEGISIGGVTLASGEPLADGENVVSYVRPHEISLAHTSGNDHRLEVEITKTHPVGPIVFIEARRLDRAQEHIEIELSKGTFDNLSIKVGDIMYAHVERFRTFQANEYMI
ncbi:sulfate/molybdate ABC transporter ATP-binding protein [Geomicrobium sediminis]|uniref:Sulfate transport system ATP-binding protein n=1 Tax=Geomicrobium sediminis TaxID=1347788 RepID=A0ABS2PAJ6_9BACL|nr:sulfate/molybdate ABC transporter ATP-binding protein [Geomicrobium sediminis]MBM7632322.1 sulfate transport system ATP-binding protein [Geomicrobium sediminis]